MAEPGGINSTNQTSHCTGLSPTKYVEIGTYSVLLLLSLTGNTLIVAVFFRRKVPRTTVNRFIVNMAFADLIIPVILLPAMITERHLERAWLVDGVIGTALCKLYWLASSLSTAVSIVSMVVIATERFHAILFAMKPPLISRKLACKIIALTWVFAVVFRSNYLYAASLMIYYNNRYCMLSNPAVKTSLIAQLCLFAISGFLLMVFYISIITTLFRNKTACSDLAEAVKQREKENRRVTCMLVVVVVVFYSVWTPNLVNSILYVIYPRFGFKQPCYFQWLTEVTLPVLHTVITPVVYYIFNNKYRKAFKELLCCLKEANKWAQV